MSIDHYDHYVLFLCCSELSTYEAKEKKKCEGMQVVRDKMNQTKEEVRTC